MSTVQDLNAASGWRILLYGLVGAWLIGKGGDAIAEIVHGPTDYGAMLEKALAPMPASPPAAKVAGLSVNGIKSDEIDSLAAHLAATYGPLPPEAIPNADGAINVGSALPWLAGLVAAAAGVAWLMHHRAMGGVVAPITVKPAGPVEVKPIDVNVKPQFPAVPGLTSPAAPGSPPVPTQQVQQVADLLKTVMQQGAAITNTSGSGWDYFMWYGDGRAPKKLESNVSDIDAKDRYWIDRICGAIRSGEQFDGSRVIVRYQGDQQVEIVNTMSDPDCQERSGDVGALPARPSVRAPVRTVETPFVHPPGGGLATSPNPSNTTHSNYWAGYTQGYPQGRAHPVGTRPFKMDYLAQLQHAGFVQAFLNGWSTGFDDGANNRRPQVETSSSTRPMTGQ